MKATLEFNLPEEQPEYDALMEAKRLADERYNALYDIANVARTALKHGADTVEALTKALEEILSISFRELN
jgi:hypothetical protein